MELMIPNLPEDLAMECLTRLPYTAHREASRVCKRWADLLLSQEFYYLRKQCRLTRTLICLVQALPSLSVLLEDKPAGGPPSYGITVFDPVSMTFERVEPVPKHQIGLPLFCQICSSEGKLVVMGGWDPVRYCPVTDVFVYDFFTREWQQGKDMPVTRSFFAIGSAAGKIYIAGGHDEDKNALKSAFVYDLRKDEWTELTQLSEARDECEGIVIGNEFWVVSGYSTDNQGRFESSAEVYDVESGKWNLVDRVWEAGRCPKSRVGVGKDGKIVNSAELDSKDRFGSFGVILGDRRFISGSLRQGTPNGIYLGEANEGQIGKLEKVGVTDEFSGLVQSGCFVEI